MPLSKCAHLLFFFFLNIYLFTFVTQGRWSMNRPLSRREFIHCCLYFIAVDKWVSRGLTPVVGNWRTQSQCCPTVVSKEYSLLSFRALQPSFFSFTLTGDCKLSHPFCRRVSYSLNFSTFPRWRRLAFKCWNSRPAGLCSLITAGPERFVYSCLKLFPFTPTPLR